MFKTLSAPIFVLVAAAGAFAQDTARMEQVIQSHVASGSFMGTVLVARDGKVVLDKGYGMAQRRMSALWRRSAGRTPFDPEGA